MNKELDNFNELFDEILKLKSKEDCEMFFSDLCSKSELAEMTQRIKAAKMLIDGKTYNEVIALTNISSTTLSRVSKALKNGKGYQTILKK